MRLSERVEEVVQPVVELLRLSERVVQPVVEVDKEEAAEPVKATQMLSLPLS